jgi:hypothetical protein
MQVMAETIGHLWGPGGREKIFHTAADRTAARSAIAKSNKTELFSYGVFNELAEKNGSIYLTYRTSRDEAGAAGSWKVMPRTAGEGDQEGTLFRQNSAEKTVGKYYFGQFWPFLEVGSCDE